MQKQFRQIQSTISFLFSGLSGRAFGGKQNRVGDGYVWLCFENVEYVSLGSLGF
jgi:hypothetical protein